MKKMLVLGFLVACIVGLYYFPDRMISPGDLMEVHKKSDNDCMACHSAFNGIDQNKCIACHKVSEIGKVSLGSMTKEKVLFHQHLKETPCTSCHSDHQGRYPVSKFSVFNHSFLDIAVLNACANCHRSPSDKLHSVVTASCNNCHKTDTWLFSRKFDHELIAQDQRNLCTTCHVKPEDDFHLKLVENCDKCHTNNAWKPSSFDHSGYFELDKDHNVQCSTCHTSNNFSAYSCYGCHEHSENKLIQEHREEGVLNISDCVSCHKNANEDDIRMGNGSGSNLKQGDAAKVREYIKSDNKGKKIKEEEED
jgi:Cytochrome c3/Doubled CXXCH motif (Paired_CXXCH_1)